MAVDAYTPRRCGDALRLAFGLGVLAAALTPEGAAAKPLITVIGEPEVVLPASEFDCAAPRVNDTTDNSPSAFRRSDGSVVFLASNRHNFIFTGPSLDDLTRVGCQQLLTSKHDPDPGDYSDNEWLTALYSEDGRLVLGFIHNEYHGEDHGYKNCDKTDISNRTCWYGAVTLVVSRDGGFTFERPAPPDNVLLALPNTFKEGRERQGIYAPKLVGNPKDGRVYVMVSFADRNRDIRVGQCLVRGPGDRLGGWEVWKDGAFRDYSPSPYACEAGACKIPPADCDQVLKGHYMSIRYLPKQDTFVALGVRQGSVVYAHSKDLIEWSEPRDLMPAPRLGSWKPGDPPPIWYFSLLDPSSSSRNFDTIEDRPYLYFARFHTTADRVVNSRRDVMRVPLRIESVP